MKSILETGFLVAIEGVDGAGKTTVSALLAQYLGERGLGCLLSKEPTGLKWGQQLRESAKLGRLSPAEELDLFQRDRADHVERSIRPALKAGHFVILDRYYWSNAAYQGSRGLDPDAIVAANERFAPRPDLILLLDVDARTGLDRIARRGDIPNDFENVDELESARTIFHRLHAQSPGWSVQIDASRSLREVADAARTVFLSKLAERLTTAAPAIRQQAHDLFGLTLPE